ncbi:MAG TPA: DUF2934 domain-containing protein [Candidatus Acidoferrales bacterium]|nr:DUF2934 domain-containing protein [Candidatus Acidoferrales bacterium]
MDQEARRKKQQEMMAELLERKIRLHAQQLYEQRGKADGMALQDWVQAESEVLGTSIMAPFYRKLRLQENPENAPSSLPESSGCESSQ